MPVPSYVTGAGYTSSGSKSFDATIGGYNTYLIVAQVSISSYAAAPTFDGTTLTELTSAYRVNLYLKLWYLRNPPTGTKTLVINGYGGWVAVYKDLDAINPFANIVSGGGGNSYTESVTVTSTVGDLVICAASHGGRDGSTMTAADGQTQRFQTGTAWYDTYSFLGEEAGAASVVTGKWTGASYSADEVTIGISLQKIASGANPVSVTPYLMT